MNTTLDILLLTSTAPTPIMLQSGYHNLTPPLALGYLGTYLKQANYSVKVIDLFLGSNTVHNVLSVLREFKTRLVGISCTTETYNIAVRLAKIVKEECKDCIVVLGGPHVTFEYASALENDEIDFIVLGEGEISLKELCDYCISGIGTLEDLKGIAYKKNGVVVCTEPQPFIKNLDDLPLPDRKLFENLHEYTAPASIITSRGCPGKCIFCAASALSGGRYRMRSAYNIVSEFEYLKSLGFNHVVILDDTMTANVKRLNEILDALLSRNLQMSWYCESRVDIMSKEILIKMKAAGSVAIQFGVESGNQMMLDKMKKNITLEQVRQVFAWCKELDIAALANLIIGLPADNDITIQSNMDIMEELGDIGAVLGFTICTPFPGTDIWRNPEYHGIEIVEHDLDFYNLTTPVFNTKYLTVKDIRNYFYHAKIRLAQIRTKKEPRGYKVGLKNLFHDEV